jgi:hypothetical protein
VDTPAGSPWTAKVTAELSPPCIAEVRFTVVVAPRLTVSDVLLALNVMPGTCNVKVAVLVHPPPAAVTVSV